MTIAIAITTELVQWVQERLDTDAEDAQNFAEEFAGALYLTGGLAESERQAAAAPDLLEACEAFVEAWEKCLQLEKTDVALRLAKAAIAKIGG